MKPSPILFVPVLLLGAAGLAGQLMPASLIEAMVPAVAFARSSRS